MRRSLLALAAAIAAIGLFAGGLGWLLDPVRPPAAASRGERLYYAYCVDCHGADGRGSWRALLFLRRPGDLADPERIRAYTDEYLFTIIRQGGDVLGRPGMPAFRQLPDEDVRALVDFVRALPSRGAPRAASRSTPAPRRRLAGARPSEPCLPEPGARRRAGPAPTRWPSFPWPTCRGGRGRRDGRGGGRERPGR